MSWAVLDPGAAHISKIYRGKRVLEGSGGTRVLEGSGGTKVLEGSGGTRVLEPGYEGVIAGVQGY